MILWNILQRVAFSYHLVYSQLNSFLLFLCKNSNLHQVLYKASPKVSRIRIDLNLL